ncbi:glycoside hydrolase family 25 protein [Mesorhizobium sp. J428]|uniref:glycoside hydrolase family 25 protein n=1 Tax=Mesorhizobium sp. J428 TaxID=2898440 RepID=UPI002151CE48|nr:glycoside hydrolase family 25 protein [Mesorhizobium sp. J428]MCR5859615.1 glycoside hydrolase family 25 protein [Mesorhizobium sp. J428]
MRLSPLVVSLLACVALAGCMSSNAADVLKVGASPETTASVSGPRPAEVVGLAQEQQALIEADADVDPVKVSALAPPDVIDEPAVKAVALVTPPKPTARPEARSYGAVQRQRFRDAKPINFGKRKPADYAVHGVDVSRWQGEIDWVKLRSQGANFAYIKATDGGDHLDPMFRKNWREADAAGLKRGAYHFFYWCRSASSQADWFIRNVPKDPNALPPVIDVEWNHLSACKKRPSRATVLEKMQVFMDKIEAHYGQRPVIYTAPDFYGDNLKNAFQNYPFWLRAVAQHPSKVYPGRDWVFWQYSGSGLSHGVRGKIDLNVFSGSESDWRRWLGKQERIAAN